MKSSAACWEGVCGMWGLCGVAGVTLHFCMYSWCSACVISSGNYRRPFEPWVIFLGMRLVWLTAQNWKVFWVIFSLRTTKKTPHTGLLSPPCSEAAHYGLSATWWRCCISFRSEAGYVRLENMCVANVGGGCYCDSAPCHRSETSQRHAGFFFFSKMDREATTNKKPLGVMNLI